MVVAGKAREDKGTALDELQDHAMGGCQVPKFCFMHYSEGCIKVDRVHVLRIN